MGAPKIDAVVFESYADASTLAQALMEGAVDLWQDVPQEQLSELKAAYDVQVVTGPGMGLRCVLLNVSDDSTSTGHPALRDPTVRLALAHAIDRQQTIDLTLGGAGMPGLGVIPPALRTWFNPNLQNVPFELQTARSILDAAAYTDTDSDGIREMPGSGTDLAFRLFIPSDSQTAARQAELLGNWMRQIGISVSTLTMDRAALEAAGCPTCDFDLLLVDREATHDPSPLLSAFSTGAPASNRNASGHSNAVYGALYDQQLSTLDVEQRRQIIWQMQEVLLEDRPCIALYYEVAVQAFRRDRFHNWLYALNGTLSLADKRSLLRVEAVR
jgi:peptide/nickel transport system substrate-binding protein